MGRRSIAFHEECLKNMRANLETTRKDVELRIAALAKSERNVAFLAEQIEAAKRRGMTAFDSERLLVKRSAKG